MALVLIPTNHFPTNRLEQAHLQGELNVLMPPPQHVTSQNAHPSNINIELLQTFANDQKLKLNVHIKQLSELENTKAYDLVALTYSDIQSTPKPLKFASIHQPNDNSTVNDKSVHWAVPISDDLSVLQQADQFLSEAVNSGLIDELHNRFFMNLDDRDQINRYYFVQRIKKRLPRYLKDFQQVGEELHLDWKLLAAISYQESQWNPKAVSPTGVRGLMMLTQKTAKEMGIENRSHPQQSILGGAKYYVKIKDRLPNYIHEPDRTWIALAAYNMGLTPIFKAIRQTHAVGGQATDWFQIREQLPMPTLPRDSGFLRGSDQAKAYVSAVRFYYDLLSQPELIANITETDFKTYPVNLEPFDLALRDEKSTQ